MTMTPARLQLLADQLDEGLMTPDERRGWALELRGIAVLIERGMLRVEWATSAASSEREKK